MDFVIKRIELLAAIAKVSQVTDDKSPSHAFRVVRIESVKKKVKFTAVGELCSVFTVSPAVDTKTPGTFNVSPKRLSDIVASMPDGDINFSLKGTRVTVKSKVSARKASFENTTVDPHTVDYPGDEVAWREMDSRELTRCLAMTHNAAAWIDGGDKPVQHLIIPRESGSLFFASNGYVCTIVTSSIRLDGPKIVVPHIATKVLSLMTDLDDKVSVFSDQNRIYFQNCDTRVSAMLAPYALGDGTETIMRLLQDPANIVGPTFQLPKLVDSVKSVLRLSSFASTDERGSRGYSVRVRLGTSISTELAFSEADANDEFDALSPGDEELKFKLSSKLLELALGSMVGVAEAQALRGDMMLILRSQGVLCGVMEERDS